MAGGAPGEGLGNIHDPTAPFFFVPSESMQALSALTIGPTFQPEVGDPNLVTDLSTDAMESAEYGEHNKKANDEPDAKSNNTEPVKDAKANDPKRFTRKGTIYYDSNLHTNIRRDTDSTGTLTDLPAKDTLPAH